jgi:hypothetical protein
LIFNENNILTSVKTKSGKEYFAKKFISNIEIRSTIILGRKTEKIFPEQCSELGTGFFMFQCLFGA